MPYKKQTFARTLTLEDRVEILEKRRQTESASTHTKLHSLTSTADHTSGATPSQIMKADANGLPVDSLYTETQFTSAMLNIRGNREGLQVTIKDASNLYISGGSIEINGAVYTVSTQLTVALGTILADTTYYVYVNPPATGTTLAAAQFSLSTTAPAFDNTKGADYKTGDGTKRYIARYYEESI